MLKHHEAIDLLAAAEEQPPSPLLPKLTRIVPSAVTLLAFVCGMSAIELAMLGRYRAAVTALILAGVLDGLDGRAARLLNSASTFGAELDSLVDFVSFGVAPAVVIYHWSLQSFAGIGWGCAVFYAACCGLRLARFNTQLHERPQGEALAFFVGVPAPAGAGLALLPLFAFLASGNPIFASPGFAAAVLAATALLMVSRIPTWSIKRFHLGDHPVLLVLGAAVVAGLLVAVPWWSFTLGAVLYAASIPTSLIAHRRAIRAGWSRTAVAEPTDPIA